jgi:hypothetical protein
MKNGIYVVKTGDLEFTLHVVHYDSIYTVRFGDTDNQAEGPCMELTYDTNEPHLLKLDNVQYRSTCTDNTKMKPGKHTRIMIRTALTICVQHFPDIRRVRFFDVSEVECQKSQNLNLGYFSLVLHGQTWYERHFKAKPTLTINKQKLEAFRMLLQKQVANDVFNGIHVQRNDRRSWMEYFNALREKEGCQAFVSLIPAIERASKIKLLYSEWYIKHTHIKSWNAQFSLKRAKTQTAGFMKSTSNVNRMVFTMEDV